MFKRFRRLRTHNTIRNLVRETTLTPDDFIYPLFVKEGKFDKIEIKSMPGVYQMDIDTIVQECGQMIELGLNSVLLFAIPDTKDSVGSECLCDNSLIARTIKAIKLKYPQMYIITDLCFCEYTDHGHCGIINPKTKTVDNDATLEISAQQAIVHAKAGVDMIAPSGMMDGIIEVLRQALDKEGFTDLQLWHIVQNLLVLFMVHLEMLPSQLLVMEIEKHTKWMLEIVLKLLKNHLKMKNKVQIYLW